MRSWTVAAVVLALLGVGVFALAPQLERVVNRHLEHAPYAVSAEARSFHGTLAVADLHADSLLWSRDLLRRSGRGHVDLPRLEEGGFALQVFPAVTKVPLGINYEKNESSGFDLVTALAVLERWPLRTWRSLPERALHQAAKLHALAARAPERLRVIRTRGDLERLLRDRAAGALTLGGLLATEGSHALGGDLANLERLHDAGFRMMGLHHFFDNELGGSLHGATKGGLSDYGRQAVRAMEARSIVVDLAHSSPAVVDDVLDLATRPVVVSHTGMRGHCDHPRNLDDARLRRIAEAGGLVGIGFWDAAVCDPTPAGIAAAIAYAVRRLGPSHVSLGSDWDGATAVPFHAGEVSVLSEALLEAGLPRDQIAAVMGENLLAFLRSALPAGDD